MFELLGRNFDSPLLPNRIVIVGALYDPTQSAPITWMMILNIWLGIQFPL